MGQAQVAIAIVMDGARRARLDVGRALQQIELAAWSEGLRTCFVGIRGGQQDEVKSLLGAPAELELVTVLPFGYRIAKEPGKPLLEIAHGKNSGEP